jgi:hypothetical protein
LIAETVDRRNGRNGRAVRAVDRRAGRKKMMAKRQAISHDIGASPIAFDVATVLYSEHHANAHILKHDQELMIL